MVISEKVVNAQHGTGGDSFGTVPASVHLHPSAWLHWQWRPWRRTGRAIADFVAALWTFSVICEAQFRCSKYDGTVSSSEAA